MNTENHLGVLDSFESQQESGSGFVSSENIRTQVQARDLLVGGMFDSGPPLGVQQNLLGEPIRNGLLTDCRLVSVRPPQEGADATSQLGLAGGDLDRSLQGNNVRFLHAYRIYKSTCDYVNKFSCVTSHKAPCILPFMPRKSAQPAIPERSPLHVGHDGRTAAERFREAYEEWKERTGGTQSALASQANRIMGLSDDDGVQQQEISQFLKGDSDLARSHRLIAIAEIIDVRPTWLAFGEGDKHAASGMLTARQIQALKDLGVPLE
jgi:hypothetical protein